MQASDGRSEGPRRGAIQGSTVLVVIKVEDGAIVLLDPDDRPAGVEKWHPFPNILRIRTDGSVVWRSELIEHETTAKCWLALDEEDGQIVARTYSYQATLDPGTGKLRQVVFTK